MSHPNNINYTQQDVDNVRNYLSNRPYNNSLVRGWYNDCQIRDGKVMMLHDNKWKELIPRERINNVIAEYYRDPLTTGNRDVLFDRIKDLYIGISRRDIQAYL